MTATLKVEVALGKGPNDSVVDGDYTDLSDRVLGFTMDRGRDDRTQSFDPGTCSIVLDNEDRMLDPMRDGALNDMAADLGLPLCPIRVSVVHDGGTDRIFTGYIGPEAWVPITNVHGKWAVRLDAMDRLAYLASLSLPSSVFAAVVQDMAPDWWIRGLAPGTVTAGYASTLTDFSGNGYDATLSSAVFGASMYAVDSMVPGDDDSAMTVQAGVSGYSDETALTGAQANVTMGCVWRGTPDAVDQEIIRQRNMTGSIVRWRLHCTTAGDLVAIIYDTGGVATDFVAAPANPDPSTNRWDDDKDHLVFVRVEGGTRLRVYADGETASVTSSIPATVAGRPIFGGGSQLASFDEVVLFQRSVTLDEMDALWGIFSGTADPRDGDSTEGRGSFWWDLTNHPRGSNLRTDEGYTEMRQVHGIREVPGNLSDALEELAVSFQGARWVDRSGVVRLRLDHAFENGTEHEADYILPQAILTDDINASDTVPIVRRTQPEFTGLRLDRVVNLYRTTWKGRTIESRDDASIDRYGERVLSWTSLAFSELDGSAVVIEESWLDVQGEPSIDVEPLTVYPLIDPGAAEWVFGLLELEQMVTLQWVDGGLLFSSDLRLQGESWSWDTRSNQLEVAVTLSPSRNGALTATATAYDDDSVFTFATEDLDALTTESDADLSDSL